MGRKKDQVAEIFESVADGLKNLYNVKIKPVEVQYRFGEFYSPYLLDADFDAKPMVLLLGQYSVGKTSFIKYLLGRDFPGAHIGPEPCAAPSTHRASGPSLRPRSRIGPRESLAHGVGAAVPVPSHCMMRAISLLL